MTHHVRRHVDVENDILELAGWIARDSPEAAFRFLDSVEKACDSLRLMPGRGSLKGLRGKLANVRSCGVSGFPNHVVLYEIRGADVFVLAVVHGARRYDRLLRERAADTDQGAH